MLSWICLSLSSNWRDRVVLPAPDGDDRTSMSPRRWIAEVPLSFDILDLLPQALDGALQIDADARQLDVGRLRAQRVGLAVELLAEEIELAPHRIVRPCLGEQGARLGDVGGQPVELFADVGLADQQGHFLGEALLRKWRRALHQLGELALEARTQRADLRRGPLGRPTAEALDLVDVAVDHPGERLALGGAGGGQRLQDLAERRRQCLVEGGERLLALLALFLLLDDAAHAQEP